MIKKRDGSLEEFDLKKITEVIKLAGERTGEYGKKDAIILTSKVANQLDFTEELSVEIIQDAVEMALMNSDYKETAKSYILYREQRDRERTPDIFEPRLNLKPFEYPHLIKYKEAIQHSYWVHTSYNYTSDIQDFKVNVTEPERNAIKNSMLAIAQVEVAVKTFWGDLYKRLPKPEVADVGYTFSESEVRHSDSYSHLLEILGMNNEFEKIKEIPELYQRVNYLTKGVALARTGDDRDYALSILLFSLFIEHVSLFSQFLIMMSFNKHKNLFKGISNVIEATSKEEQIHGMFGIELINIIKEENPEWFDEELETAVYEACKEAYRSEEIVIEWIYEQGDLDFMPKEVVKEFVKNRLNNSLESIGYEKMFDVDEELVSETDWFDDEIIATKHTDFFNKKNINYTIGTQSFTGDDLF